MYKIEHSNFAEFKKVCAESYEPGDPEFCEDYEFDKLVCDNQIICMIGHLSGQNDQGETKTFIVGAFTPLTAKHLKVIVKIGNLYLDAISRFPGDIIVESGNKKFERFAEFFGFKKTLAQVDQNSIMYSTYIRG